MRNLSSNTIGEILRSQGQPGQPISMLDVACTQLRKTYGFRLLTYMIYEPGTGELQRIYSSMPDIFPLGGRKPMGPTSWGDHVLRDGKAWASNSAQELYAVFPDADNIVRSAGEACICLPVRWNGETRAVLSLCDRRDAYNHLDITELEVVAQTLLPAASL